MMMHDEKKELLTKEILALFYHETSKPYLEVRQRSSFGYTGNASFWDIQALQDLVRVGALKKTLIDELEMAIWMAQEGRNPDDIVDGFHDLLRQLKGEK